MAQPESIQSSWEGELFRLLVENARDYAVFLVDLGGRVLTWNPGAERVLGYTAGEMPGQSAAVIFTPEDRARGAAEQELRTTLTEGRAEDNRWHVRKDGTRVWCHGVMVPLRDEAGRVRACGKILRDSTDAKLAAEALRESEGRLRVALDAAEMGTWLWRIAADQQFLDGSLRRLMGLKPGEEVRTLDDFLRSVHPEDRAAVRVEFERCVREDIDLRVEFRVIWPDGTVHWLRDQGKVFHNGDDGPAFMTGACVDITARKRAEESLAEAARRKDEFLAMLGHELRNPLAPIRNGLQILKRVGHDPEAIARARDMMDRQVQQMARLVDDLLDVSRITRGVVELRRTAVDVGDVVARAVETARPLIDAKGHRLSVTRPDGPVLVEGDPVRLAQVVGNLLNDAAKYTPDGGDIAVSLAAEGAEVVVRVRDNGSGIPADVLPHVFDLFTQAERTIDRSQGGLGIGLTVVRSLVEMHGGSAEAHSEGPGRGSEFVIRLPSHRPSSLVPGPSRETGGEGPGTGDKGQIRVLVVDDNVDAAESLATLLQLSGHEVRAVYDGPGALAAARAFRPGAVVLDVGLPGMDGYEVARRLRREPGGAEMLLIALTGYGQDDDRRRSEQAGFDHHLVKPADPLALEAALRPVPPAERPNDNST